jgi:hypothetical protein
MHLQDCLIPGCLIRALLLIGALALALPPLAAAQTSTATLFIEARDESGALLPGVVVSLTNQETGIGRAGVTSPDGSLAVPALPAATYTLTAAIDGFKTEIVRDIRVQAAVKSTLNLTLKPGALTEQVVVTADATTLRIGNSAVGEVFEDRTLVTLPVTERDPLQFTYHAAGISPPAPGSRLSGQGNVGLNSGGAREASNNFLLDGVDNNDLFLNRLVVNPSLDAIKEMALVQNTYDAEYGRSAGAQVSVVLKSGTRSLRGSAYEYFRHSKLDSRNIFEPLDQPEALLRKHQFGGTLGGPMGKLPSFYFVNVEGIKAREAETRLAHVPTAAERAGDFSGSGLTLIDPFTQRPFAGNRIPAGRISPAGAAAAGLYPSPNRDDPDANFVSSPLGERNAIQWTVKTDHHGWRENPFNVRYSFSRDNRDLPFPAHGRNLPGFGISVLDQGHNVAAGLSQAWSSRVFNDLRIGFNSLRRENLPQSSGVNGFDLLGIRGPALDSIDLGYPTFVLPGFESLGDDSNLPVVRKTKTIHISDSVSIDSGRHHFKMGGELRHYESDGFNHLFGRGEATFLGVYTGHPVADLLLGFPTFTLLAGNDNRQALRTNAINLFAQDDWRITPTLTVNAGVRYEYNQPPYDTDDRMRIYDATTNSMRQVGEGGLSRSGLNGDFNNIAPRVGASWDLTGQGTWLLRGGYGMFYDSGTLIENSALYFNEPYWALQLFFPSETAPIFLDDPFPTGGGFTPSPAVNTLDPNFRTAYSHQGSVAIERAFINTTLTARYVTSHGRNFVRKRNVNQAVPGPGDLDPRRPTQGFGDILLVESQATSSYHGLQLSAVRRHSKGLSFRGSYTLSKALDDASAFLATDGDDNTPQDSRNVAAEWGPSDFDVRHRLVLTTTWEIPSKSGSDLLAAFTRDWQVSAIFSAQSGRPFTPRVSFDNSNSGNIGGGTFAYDRPNVVSGTPSPGVETVSYGGQTFAIAPPFTYGNAGRNSLTGPAYASLDAVISRRLLLWPMRTLELRLEVFNALNRKNYQIPDSFVDRATFGQSLSAFPPRQLQLAARFTF